jgi:hypothetical protein
MLNVTFDHSVLSETVL